GLAVAALQLLPITFDLFSYGNLSNVFSDAVTAVFFAWWAAGGPGGWPIGALLLATGALGHFSSLVVLTALAAALLMAWRGERPLARWRLLSLAAGVGLAALYYAHFLPLVVGQLSRLGEGSTAMRSGRTVSGPLLAVVTQWGLPAIALAVAGLPRP